MSWNWAEREELEAEYWARADYLREAFGPTAVDPFDDYDPDPEADWWEAALARCDAAGGLFYRG